MNDFNKVIFYGIILFLLLMAKDIFAQNPDWIWAKTGTSFSVPYTYADQEGNLFATGTFTDTITLGDTTLKNSNVNGSYWDMLLVKYNPNGDILWARASTGIAGEEGLAVTTDNNGNVYVLGQFSSFTMSFPTENGDITLTSTGSTDIFVVKYTSDGKVVWARSAKGSGGDFAYGITSDSAGNVYITGGFHSPTLSFGSHTLTMVGTSARNGYIVKYDTDGNELWAKSFEGNLAPVHGGQIIEFTNKIKTDKHGNTCVTGQFTGPSITFGDTSIVNNDPSPNYPSKTAMFIVKYNTDGNRLWAKTANGDDSNSGNSVSIDNEGSIYVTGRFSGTSIVFDTTRLFNTQKSDDYRGDFFLAKYNSNGQVEWVRSGGGTSDESPTSITIDNENNVYVLGHFFSADCKFGLVTLRNARSSNNSRDIFIAKYSSTGQLIGARSFGTTLAKSLCISADANGFVYASGTFYQGSITLGNTILESTEVTNNLFIGKLSNVITSITEDAVDFQYLVIAPNPVQTMFQIRVHESAIWFITIYSITGEMVYDSYFSDSKSIDLSGKAKGTYIYQLQKDSEIVKTGKLILE